MIEWETGESIRVRVQAARNIQLARFSSIESLNIVAIAAVRIGRDTAVLPVAGRRRCTELLEVSEFDAGDNQSA